MAHRSTPAPLLPSLALVACVIGAGFIPSAMAEDASKAGEQAAAKSQAANPSDSAAAPENKAAEDAQKKLANEDPTKVVKKADAADEKPSGDPAVEMQANGMWLDKDGNPTPHFTKDGNMDWFTFSGYRRYGANCLQCHGPDALGSSYAPSLVDSLKTLDYGTFLQTIAAGKKNVSNSQNLVMPSFGDNKNVECYVNDIYVYIRARSLGLLDRRRPSDHEPKPAIYGTQETACIGF